MKKYVVFLSFLLLLTACFSSSSEKVNPFFLKTPDEVRISTNYFPGVLAYGVIMLPDSNVCKTDWGGLDSALVSEGFHVLTIDFRDSCMSDFVDSENSKLVLDVGVAVDYLHSKGVRKIVLLGDNFGASVAVKYSIQNNDLMGLVLLAPVLQNEQLDISSNIEVVNIPVLVFADSDESLMVYKLVSSEKRLLPMSEPVVIVDYISEWLWSSEHN